MTHVLSASQRQKQHYETIHGEYEAHYYDAPSLAYRERFIMRPLLHDVDLHGKRLLDVASGSGFNTQLVRNRFADIDAVGLDISDAACRAYTANTGFRAVQADLTAPVSLDAPFDAAIVVGGLHHCVANLPATLANLAAALRPGGVLMMMEPSADCWLEGLRNRWYQRDPYFDAPTEHALSHDQLLQQADGAFAAERLCYAGGPAYFAILNSLVLRVPLASKPWLTPILFPLEAGFNALNSRRWSAVFLARWRRR